MKIKNKKLTNQKNKVFSKRNSDTLVSTIVEKKDEENTSTISSKEIELNLNVDKKEYLISNIEKIEVFITEEPKEIFDKKVSFAKNMSKKTNSKAVNLKIKNINKIRKRNFKEKNNKIQKLTEINPVSVIDTTRSSLKKFNNIPDSELFGTTTQIIARPVQQKKQITKNQYEIQKKFSENKEAELAVKDETISKSLKKNRREKKDISSLIQKDIGCSMPQNLFQRIKGTIDAGNKNTSSTTGEITKKIKNIVSRQQNGIKTNYVIEKKKVINRNEKITKKIKINNNTINKIAKGRNLNIVYKIKNKQGKVVQSLSSKIEISKENKKNNDDPNFNYEIKAFRKNNRTYLKISNLDIKDGYVNVYMKKHHELFYEGLDEFILVGKKVLISAKNQITLEKENHTGAVTFRVLPVTFDNVEYSNFKTDTIASTHKGNLGVFPGMYAKVNYENELKTITVFAKNLPNSEEYSGIQLAKRNLSKKEKHYKRVINLRNNKEEITGSGRLITLYDNDVQNNNIYEYKLILYDANKNKYFSGSSFVEEYEEKSGLVSSRFTKNPKITGNILRMSLNTAIIKKDADRLFEDLFGSLYNLFEEDLKEIKDVNALSISLDASMINKGTGEVVDIGKFKVDSSGNTRIAVILPDDYDYYEEYCVKIKPRILPPVDVLSRITTTIDELSKQEGRTPVSFYSTPSIKKKNKNKDNDVISSIGNKFTSRIARTKGRIEDQSSFLERTSYDFYYDGSTGDQIYFDLPGLSINTNNLLTNFKILKIRNKNYNKSFNKNQRIEKELKIKITGQYDYNINNDIDFFIAAYEENGVIKNEGLAYAKNSKFNFLYVLQSPIGEVNFFFIPVTKSGTIKEKIHAGTRYINSLGEMSGI